MSACEPSQPHFHLRRVRCPNHPASRRTLLGTGRSPQRQPADYHKLHGVRQFHGCYSAGDNQLRRVVRHRKSATNTLRALQPIWARRPDGGQIDVILDNLSAYKGQTIKAWAKHNRVGLCFTPAYSSQANPIEARFRPLQELVLNNSNHPTTSH